MNVIVFRYLILLIVGFGFFTGCKHPDPLYYNDSSHAIEACNGSSINAFRIYYGEYGEEIFYFSRKDNSTSKYIIPNNLTQLDFFIQKNINRKNSDNSLLKIVNLKPDMNYRISSYSGDSGMSRDSFELKFRVDTLGNVIWASRTACQEI